MNKERWLLTLKAKNGMLYLKYVFQELFPSYFVFVVVTSNLSCVNDDSQFITLSLEISLVTWSMKNSIHKRILRGLFYNVGSWHYIWKPWENNSSDCLKSIDFRSVCLWERHGMSLMRWHKWLFYHCHCSDVFGWF